MSDALTLRVREQNENWREIGPFHHTKLSQNISAPMKKKQITWKSFNSGFKLLFLLVVKRKNPQRRPTSRVQYEEKGIIPEENGNEFHLSCPVFPDTNSRR